MRTKLTKEKQKFNRSTQHRNLKIYFFSIKFSIRKHIFTIFQFTKHSFICLSLTFSLMNHKWHEFQFFILSFFAKKFFCSKEQPTYLKNPSRLIWRIKWEYEICMRFVLLSLVHYSEKNTVEYICLFWFCGEYIVVWVFHDRWCNFYFQILFSNALPIKGVRSEIRNVKVKKCL